MTYVKPKEVSMSEVLHLAADRYLIVNRDIGDNYLSTCFAIWQAFLTLSNRNSPVYPIPKQIKDFFGKYKELGVDISNISNFDEFPEGETRQSVRYTWLKFCALLLEEGAI